MSNSNISLETLSTAMDRLPNARDTQANRSQREAEAASQAIQAATGMPPLTEFFSYQAKQIAAQSQNAILASTQPTFIQELLQQIRALKTPEPVIEQTPATPAEHINVTA